MDYSSLRTAADIITAFQQCQNAGEQIDLFEALATSYEPPVEEFVKILTDIKLEPLIVLTIYTFGKIKDADSRERLQQSEDLLAILSEQAKSGETDSIRLSAAKTVVNLGFDFIALSRYFREDPKRIADRITRNKLKEKGLFYAKYNEVRDLKSKLDRQLEEIKSINSDVYDRVIANNTFKDIPSVNIVDDDEYDLIINDYLQALNILNDDDYVQSLRDESSRLQGQVSKFYKDYKENQLAILDDKIAIEKVSLKKAKLAKITYPLTSFIVFSLILWFWAWSHWSSNFIAFFYFPGVIFPIITIIMFDRKIKSAEKNIEEAENQKSNGFYRIDDNVASVKASLQKAKLAKATYFLASFIISYLIIFFILKIESSIRYLFVIIYALFIFSFLVLNTIDLRKGRIQYTEEQLAFDILLFLLGGGSILPFIVNKIYEIKIKSAQTNIKKAENRKSNEPYRLDDEEQKILNLLSI